MKYKCFFFSAALVAKSFMIDFKFSDEVLLRSPEHHFDTRDASTFKADATSFCVILCVSSIKIMYFLRYI